ncbi:YHS domain-containing (seleno)protein [Sinimarinibacterium sp. CAU 1509]|uniref:YHS domain-containing (seleno)protein n=1 Tax=Sinimarinibacterium sp. CAU 1509 TaxID=2562283 RepID=UPI001B7F8869|nr:YHS domain-containing (seleno)protein [Sinimarinibacterium sp. CAU 1509]
MRHHNILASIVLAASAIAAPLSVQAADEHNVSLGYSAAGAPLAVHGYDPVSYFTDGKPMRGSDELTVVHDGAAYRFASAEHRDLFKANPARYAPQFGGYCAYGVSVGKKFDGDPMLWTIRDERLYLNLNPEIVAAFNKDVPGNIKKAEGKWQKIEHSAVKDL